MEKTGHDSESAGGGDSLSALLSQSRHLLANRLIHAYQEELDYELIETHKVDKYLTTKEDACDIEDEIGLTTIDQRLDCQKNEVTNFESRQGDTKGYFSDKYTSERPVRRTITKISIPSKEVNESVGPFGNFSTIQKGMGR